MFAGLYQDSTNPTTSYVSLIQDYRMYLSILAHTAVYVVSFILLYYSITGYLPSKVVAKLVIILIILMWFGYMGRLHRAKGLWKIHHDHDKVSRRMDNAYFCWYFLG